MKRAREALDEPFDGPFDGPANEPATPQLGRALLLTPPSEKEPCKRAARPRAAVLPSFQRTLDGFLGVPSRPVWPCAEALAPPPSTDAPALAQCAACGAASADPHEIAECEICAASSCRACSVRRDSVRCLDCCK